MPEDGPKRMFLFGPLVRFVPLSDRGGEPPARVASGSLVFAAPRKTPPDFTEVLLGSILLALQ